jgi:hypothetical protein
MSNGQSWGGALGIGTEGSFGQAVEPRQWLPINSESVRGRRSVFMPATICASRVRQMGVPGLREASGGIQLNGDAVHLGLPLYYLTGNVDSAPLAGSVAANPTVTASPNGFLPDGNYKYQVCSVLKQNSDNSLFMTTLTGFSEDAVCGDGKNQVTVAWVNPSSTPEGYSHHGTIIYRTAVGGTPESTRLLAIVMGGDESYTDTGSVALGDVQPPTGSVYQHTFRAGTGALPSFSVTKLMDNDRGQRFSGCRMNSLKLALGDAGNPVSVDLDLLARDWEDIDNPTPSFELAQPFMNWQAAFYVDGTIVDRLEALELTLANNLQAVPGLSGSPCIRNIASGIREASGSMTLAFENHDYWQKVRESQSFSGYLELVGDAAGDGVITDPVFIQPWRYGMRVNLTACKAEEAGGNLSGSERMTEQIPFMVYDDTGVGYEAEFILYNTTASYTEDPPGGGSPGGGSPGGGVPHPATQVTSSTPSNNYEGWAVDSLSLTLNFSAGLRQSDAENPSFYTLEDVETQTPVSIDAIVYNDSEHRVTVSVASNFAYDTWYRLSVSTGIMDANSQLIVGYTLEFKTQPEATE